MQRAYLLVAALFWLGGSVGPALAHGGGLNADGCHNERRTGGYHCHRGSYRAPAPRRPLYSPPPAATAPNTSLGLLGGAVPSPPDHKTTVELELSSAEIMRLQAKLKALGYYSGAIDGLAGPGTESGLRRWLSDSGML